MPGSPKGWLRWTAYVLGAQSRPHSMRYEHGPRRDHRLCDSRETALSIKMLLEKATNGNGGAELLARFYVAEASWHSFTEKEQRLIAKTAKAFAQTLREEGFVPPSTREER